MRKGIPMTRGVKSECEKTLERCAETSVRGGEKNEYCESIARR